MLRRCLLALLVAAVGCAAEPDLPRPNVILITVDTLRADRLPFLGSPANTAPFLDELAGRSLVFENAWAPSSWTVPSAVTVVTSVHPFQHGVNSLAGLELAPGEEPVPVACIPDEVETLAEVLSAAGYRTYGIASNILVGAEIAFDRGFDRFVKLDDLDADAVNAVAASWRDEMLASEPFFLYVHYFDPHDTFHAREPWFEPGRPAEETGWSDAFNAAAVDRGQLDWIMTRIDPLPPSLAGRSAADLSLEEIGALLAWTKAAYDSEIGFADARIRDLYEMLEMERAIVVFLSDHGEEFYEHEHLTHGQNLYSETVRAPLLLRLPGPDAPRGRVSAPVGTIDVVPTLRRLLGLPASKQDRGHDLLDAAARGPVLGYLEPDGVETDANLRSIVSGDWRLIADIGGSAELYDVARDPRERVDRAAEHPEIVAELLAELERIERSAPRYPRTTRIPPPPSEAMLEHLRGIGYIGK